MPELFNQSTLEMSTSPLTQEAAGLLWGEVTVNRIAVIVVLVLLVLELMDLIMLFPHLMRCVPFWKGNLELEHSVSLSRTRNTIALVAGIAICLMADRYSLMNPSWRAFAPTELQLLITSGLIAATLLIRYLLYLLTPFRSRTSEYSSTLRNSIYNYFILYAVLALLSVVLLEAAGAKTPSIRVVLTVEAALVYLLDFWRTAQIFRSRYGLLPTILYLCGLEVLPVGILLLTCTQ